MFKMIWKLFKKKQKTNSKIAYNKIKSEKMIVKSAEPKGSILGPQLFFQ